MIDHYLLKCTGDTSHTSHVDGSYKIGQTRGSRTDEKDVLTNYC